VLAPTEGDESPLRGAGASVMLGNAGEVLGLLAADKEDRP